MTIGWDELFWIAFEQSTTAMGITRDDHVCVAANDAVGRLTGYEPRQLVGQLSDALLPENWRRVRERDDETLHTTSELDVRRELLHACGRRLRLRLVARRVALAGHWLTLWTAHPDDTPQRATPTPQGRVRALTPRELEVIAGLAKGLRVRDIAVALGISSTTVTTHVRNATNKLRARSRTHLVGMVLAQELVDPNVVLDEEER